MNNRPAQYQLLFVLLRHTSCIPLQKLAQKLGCSESTVLRRIEEAQSLLPQKVCIEVSRACGCRLVGDRQAVWDLIARLREKKFFMMWRSREERQFLILMHLLCTRGTSKLSVLGTATHVAAATVLEDIRRLNAFLHPVFIDSRPGAGTKIIGDAADIQRKVMEYCYSVLSPINFVALACGRRAKICPCASEIFLNLLREKVPIPRIIESINTWEKRNDIILSDLAFSNLLIYLVILQLRVHAHLHVAHDDDASASLDVAALLPDGAHAGEAQLLARFLLGLEEDLFMRHCAQQESFDSVCEKIVACLARHETIVQHNVAHRVMKLLMLLRYRKGSLFAYWDAKLQPRCEERLVQNSALMRDLYAICNAGLDIDMLVSVLHVLREGAIPPSINVTLFCAAGVSTAKMMKNMIERYCPRLKVNKICSIRNCSHEDISAPVILSTIESDVLPAHTVVVNALFDEYKWNEVQEHIFHRMKQLQEMHT